MVVRASTGTSTSPPVDAAPAPSHTRPPRPRRAASGRRGCPSPCPTPRGSAARTGCRGRGPTGSAPECWAPAGRSWCWSCCCLLGVVRRAGGEGEEELLEAARVGRPQFGEHHLLLERDAGDHLRG